MPAKRLRSDPISWELKLSLLNLVGLSLLNLVGDLSLGECKVLLLNGSGTPAGPVNGVNGGRRSGGVGCDTDTEKQELRDRQADTACRTPTPPVTHVSILIKRVSILISLPH